MLDRQVQTAKQFWRETSAIASFSVSPSKASMPSCQESSAGRRALTRAGLSCFATRAAFRVSVFRVRVATID